jgi:putative PIN family toxin of toxin-antitoxin system
MRRVVVDTNVLVSGFASIDRPTSAPAELVRRWQMGGYVLLTSEYVLNEVAEVLGKRYFRQTAAAATVHQAIALLRRRATIVPIAGTVSGAARHRHDDPVLETAVAGDAEFLVTGDRELRPLGSYEGIAILTPIEFLATLDHGQTEEPEDSAASGGASAE